MFKETGRKTRVGYKERVEVCRPGEQFRREFAAKLDTGAHWNRIGKDLQERLKLPLSKRPGKVISFAKGHEFRNFVWARVRIAGRKIRTEFSVSKKPGVLLGRRTIGSRFVIDPGVKFVLG
jgi:hypothetical protein